MCGLAASLSNDLSLAMIESMRYRGTQFPLMWKGVAHVRMPIVGLSKQHDQPAKVGPWTIAFVGEILDFRERDPRAESDLPLVVRTWLSRGAEGFQNFDGFWSVAARVDDEIHLLCDYLAQKPLYYRTDEVAAASEPRPLLLAGPATEDSVYMAAVAKWGYCPEPQRTPWREIKKVLAGEHVLLQRHRNPLRTIADPLAPLPMSPRELRDEVVAAVRRRVLAADVPVAALVSGGLDSAIVYKLARRFGDVHAYHVENGEGPEAAEVIGDPDFEHVYLEGVPLERALDFMQEPLDLGSLVPQVALSDALGGKVHVALTGDGADELFGGYGRSMRYDSQASDVWHELQSWHLPRLDRVMMRNQVEVRSPFLARRVAGGALALPWEGSRQDKRFLREMFRGDLPASVVDRPKTPLRLPIVALDREARSLDLIRMHRSRA